ncbi:MULTISPECIES: VanZ family protein [Paenibacillus]|uniref:Glycopeptide antibiotics resistance protein n=1 Tax=Paenibacillus pabuli TaxID=1472 RepID=A0A855Y5W2_9BACL|nr:MULTISPECIES: VanZ family protein [Paenibacillus]PWW38011.1 glycopeptide antibiotics resistance protein [Paenibacillus pabuli]PXW08238.1 glycopeptide antibiotics resistance protein [Paenibacillus taichungensis]RAI94392.1 glycopeptide antibiotics resistance protein [Paenibacillus pabuli]
MSPYVFPVQTAFFIFVLVAMFLLVPWLIYGYRKDGFFSWSRFGVSFSFIFYLLAAYCLVILPFPTTRNTCAQQAADTVYYNLVPFTFVKDIMKETPIVWSQPASYMGMIQGRAFLQVLFNVMLLMPLGVYIRYFWQKRTYWKQALLSGFGLSLFFEITQITGFYGYYDCPYRLFDVDDLLLNTSGTVLGFFAAPILLALFPSRASIQAKSELILEQNKVYPVPQLLALIIDGVVVVFLSNLMSIFNWSNTNVIVSTLNTAIAMLFVFFFIPSLRDGKTPGSALMRFRYVNRETGEPSSASLFKRLLALYAPWILVTVAQFINDYAFLNENVMLEPYKVWISVGIFGLHMLILLVLFVHVMLVLFSRGKRAFYCDDVSKTRASRK